MAGAGPRYETTLDRAGQALGAGGVLCGVLAVLLAVAGGQHAPLALLGTFVLGTLLAALGITAVAGPVWLMMHIGGRRGPAHAALVGASCCLLVFAFAQTYGFGLLPMPETDERTLFFRWVSALATSVLVALAAALVGLAMWRVAYRRVDRTP